MIQPGRLGRKTGFDIAQALSRGQLGKRQDAEMLSRGKSPDATVSSIATDDAGEGGPGEIIHPLGEQHFAGIHVVLQRSFLEDYM